MIKFLKERFLAVLFLSVIFTFSSLFWTSDVVYKQEDLRSIELGWPVNFAIQNHSQLSPPEWWFPKEIGLGIPQEYPIGFYTAPFIIDIIFSFILIFSLVFAILKTYPNSKVLSELIKAKYIVGLFGSLSLLFIFYIIFITNINQLQMGIGVLPTVIEKPVSPKSVSDIKVFVDNPHIPVLFESKELGFSFKYLNKYKDVSYLVANGYRGGDSGKIFHGGVFEKVCPPECSRYGISFSGMTDDYSAPRGGMATDNIGYEKKDGKYFVIRVGGDIVDVTDMVEEIKTATAEGILIRGRGISKDGPGLGWNEGILLAIFKLKNSEFSAVNFYNPDITKVPEEDFMYILRSVDIYRYDGNKVLNTYYDNEYGFQLDYPSYLNVEIVDGKEIKMIENFGKKNLCC